MILQALTQLAEAEGLVADPDFEIKLVSRHIVLDPVGMLIRIASQRNEHTVSANGKSHSVSRPELVPRMPIRTRGDLAYFLVDKSEYVLGFDPAGKQKPEKLQNRARLFREQIKTCLLQTSSPAVGAVASFLERLDEFRAQIARSFDDDAWTSNDLFAFQVGLASAPVHLLDSIRQYWKSLRFAEGSKAAPTSPVCLVTGKPVADGGPFPLAKKLPGASSSGASLISFNARAFESFGLVGNENAVISRDASEKAATALNRLLDPAYPDPRNVQNKLGRRIVRVGDTSVCFWSSTTTRRVTDSLETLTDLFDCPKPERVEDINLSDWRETLAPIDAHAAFYVLILSGAQGRAIVREWIASTLDETLKHLAQHFADLSIACTARPKAGRPVRPFTPLSWQLDSLTAPGRFGTPAPLVAAFLRSAFTGSPYPIQILQRALARARVESGRNEWIDAARNDARASLMRAALNRRRRFHRSPEFSGYTEVPVTLNPAFESDGYSLGSLLAVLERLHQAAHGGGNASVVRGLFGLAAAAPRSVFVQLLKNSRHHARQANGYFHTGGVAGRLELIIDHYCARFQFGRARRSPFGVSGLPGHLDLDQQGLFVIGYHHMRHWLWLKTGERHDWEADHRQAPSVFRIAAQQESESASSSRAAE